ncbi:3-oxo-tetronate kinase [Enterovirga aerilata]|uniref:3-oxo-tetronate kinase n=1 Tax=Enterovirga aerilata TaxID=2730920 RepID=A0A849IEA7_9HYPH|nr:3-oxo-tetronate kinase [Enterovirga sp. DB1703]NNM74307.1 four-carbon acid sugar kinase family protein [Enterovirga sp. DB1703]
MGILIGCIADDFTGATDLAGMLVKAGFRTVQTVGAPEGPLPAGFDAVVVALKSRTCPAEMAVRDSLAALQALRASGAEQVYFKYCSTFDSTPAGNIGPVADALLDALEAAFTVVCPAFPANGRTIYKGHLFVGDVPLDESGMRDHPLTPMRDSSLVRLMQAQTDRKVGLVAYETVRGGPRAIRNSFAALRADGVTYAVTDALTDEDLAALGAACDGLPLVTAGSGLALGLGPNFRDRLPPGATADRLPRTSGRRAVISGSCSVATRAQVARMRERHPAFRVLVSDIARGEDVVGRALAWAAERADGPVLVYATAEPEEVREAQAAYGADAAGGMVEKTLAAIARSLVAAGVGQLIVAGGETSGAVVQTLGVTALAIGPEIDPGVPWTATIDRGRTPLALALKSGNFGTEDFFLKAWDRLPE